MSNEAVEITENPPSCFNLVTYLFCFWLCYVFIGAHRLFSSCNEQRLLSCCGTPDLGHVGFTGCGLKAVEHRLSSCGAGVHLLPWHVGSFLIRD